eukprot:CAMPEP_0114460472 /NCGR_PEP_ID=MMETSP0104-20121206/5767_1 /TAXON_ID=37642 ORGANISM="Paraphysomonas imperforata, Strain PA2" /NCGR_SAMPLE_ID=MMETSP0104 /ASSEMBLY_ACC=CAM_ASM_000202 /LENGTH=271 /DNA_ID=CAMNT_0001633193 /DNA_START=37 /DNA_END=852 /DNA_ORIENTATION=-
MALQTFLVTGANRGIGLGLVREILTLKNSRVLATCRDPQGASELSTLLQTHPDRMSVFPLDVASQDSFSKLVADIADSGITSIDVLIANAGIIGERQNFMHTSPADMTNVFNTNVIGPLLTFQSLSPLVLTSQSRLFMTISSNMGSVAATAAGSGGAVSYRVSKAAANMLSTCFAVDPAVKEAGAKVLCVHPGWVQTDMGNSGGRSADITSETSASGIIDLATRTAQLQATETYGREPGGEDSGPKEFEAAFKSSDCNLQFVNYDGRLLQW